MRIVFPRKESPSMRLALLALLVATSAAGAADLGAAGDAAPLDEAAIPACDDPAVLAEILERQHWAEENTWKDGVRIEAVSSIRQRYGTTRFVSSIAHRHCEAIADLSNARDDRLIYVIEEGMGFASIGWNVEFCLPRHDAWRVYDGGCRVLR